MTNTKVAVMIKLQLSNDAQHLPLLRGHLLYGKNSTSHLTTGYGCFLKWWYPQIIHFNRVFHYKPSNLGYPYFWKHLCGAFNWLEFIISCCCCSLFPKLQPTVRTMAHSTWLPTKAPVLPSCFTVWQVANASKTSLKKNTFH